MSNLNIMSQSFGGTRSKSELCAHYGVSPYTLSNWVKIACERIKLFTFEDYRKIRILPPKWVKALMEHLGVWLLVITFALAK